MSDAMMSGSGSPLTGPMAAMPAESAGMPMDPAGAPVPRHGEAALPGEPTGSLSRVGSVESAPVAPATERTYVERERPYAMPTARAVPMGGLLMVGMLTLLIGAWAGIAVFAGPAFNWNAGGAGAWTWNLVRAVVHAVPGIAAVLAGILMISGAPGLRGRSEAALGGLIAVLAGAWLVIGPSAWPLFNAGGSPYGAGGGLTGFTYAVGANLGPGLLIAVLGAMAIAWGLHSPRVAAAAPMAGAPVAPARPMV